MSYRHRGCQCHLLSHRRSKETRSLTVAVASTCPHTLCLPQHLRQMLVVGEAAGKHIDEFSLNFKNEFITLLSRR